MLKEVLTALLAYAMLGICLVLVAAAMTTEEKSLVFFSSLLAGGFLILTHVFAQRSMRHPTFPRRY